MTNKIDDQRKSRWRTDDDAVVEAWARSLREHGLQGLLLHDSCSEDFCSRWRGETGLEFRAVGKQLRWTSVYEERWAQALVLLDELRSGAPLAAEPRVFFTDVSDVTFHGNPFSLVTDDAICVGTEPGDRAEIPWMQAEWQGMFGRPAPSGPVYNCGILGGTARSVQHVAAEMWRRIDRYRPGADMVPLNDVMDRWPGPIVTGRPLHSAFKSYETDGGYCIRHK